MKEYLMPILSGLVVAVIFLIKDVFTAKKVDKLEKQVQEQIAKNHKASVEKDVTEKVTDAIVETVSKSKEQATSGAELSHKATLIRTTADALEIAREQLSRFGGNS